MKSCLIVGLPKRFFCLLNKANVLYKQGRIIFLKKNWAKLVGKEMEKIECWENPVKQSQEWILPIYVILVTHTKLRAFN